MIGLWAAVFAATISTNNTSAGCASKVLYQGSSDPTVSITATATDSSALYVAETRYPQVTIRRVDIETATVRDVITLSSPIGSEMLSVPPLLIYSAASSIDPTHAALFSFDGRVKHELAEITGPFGPLRSDGEQVYWLIPATRNPDPDEIFPFRRDGAILRVPLGGGQVQIVAAGLPFGSRHDFALREDDVVFVDDEGLHAVLKTGATPSLLFAATDLASIANANSSEILVTSFKSGCYSFPGCTKGSGSVLRLRSGDNAPETIASVPMDPLVDGAFAFVNGEVIYLHITAARSAVPLGGVFLLFRGRIEQVTIDPFFVPIGVQRGLLIGGRGIPFGDFDSILAMCAPVQRRAVSH